MAVSLLSRAMLAGEMGHTPKGMPKTFALILGPTGTGKTKAVKEASKYLYGTEMLARLNMAEFKEGTIGSFLPTLVNEVEKLLKAGGRFLLLDEIEKADPRASDLFLGMEEAQVSDPTTGRKLDLSDLHIFVTSNVGARDLSELEEGIPFPIVKRVVEDAAQSQFRPEVFARFTHVVIYNKLTRDAQINICHQMLDEELTFQQGQLAGMFGHDHQIEVGDGVFRRLLSEGYHRDLGARPMRNVVNIRIRDALVRARINGVIHAGITSSRLVLNGDEVVLVSATRQRGSVLL